MKREHGVNPWQPPLLCEGQIPPGPPWARHWPEGREGWGEADEFEPGDLPCAPAPYQSGARYHFLSAGEEVYGGKAHGGFFPLPELCCLCFAGRQARFSFAIYFTKGVG